MVKFLRNEQWVGISPDGPHGPRMIASPGIVHVSRIANVPIFPIVYSANKVRVMKTWDRFLIPLPFCKGVFIWGDEIAPPSSSSKDIIEITRKNVESELNKISIIADNKFGNKKKLAGNNFSE